MKKLCLFGDSVGKGVIYDSAKKKYVYSALSFVKRLCAAGAAEIENHAKFGCTVEKGLELLEKNARSIPEYDGVLLEFGGNDCDFDWAAVAADADAVHVCNVPPSRFGALYASMIRRVRELGCEPVVVSITPVDAQKYCRWISRANDGAAILRFLGSPERIARWNERYNQIVLSLAADCGVRRVLDIRSPLLEQKDYSGCFCEDGIHPNEKGHDLIFRALLGQFA